MIFATLRTARKLLKISQSELAHRAGISLATVQNIEAERANPEWSTIQSMIEALGLQIEVKAQSLDWSMLAKLGCPILAEKVSQGTEGNKETLTRFLQQSDTLFAQVKPLSHDGRALLAWPAAIQSHYPTYWRGLKLTYKPPRDVSAKLRRIALDRLSEIL